jgi:hypothetical protein
MCLIIYRGKGENVPNNILEYNSKSNPDGFGLAWRNQKKLEYQKFGPGAAEYARFRDLLKSVDGYTNIEYVAHFRKATHGGSCEALSHPFVYEDSKVGPILVFHNGIININAPKGESDTSQFVKGVLAKLESRWWTKDYMRWLVEESIGWSRLLLMTPTQTIMLNKDMWKLRDKIWYSCDPLPTVKYYTSGKGYARSAWANGYDDFMVEDDDDDDEKDDVEPVVNTKGQGWYIKVAGQTDHYVIPVEPYQDEKGDEYGVATCTVCHTTGEYYIIEGQAYVDVPHGVLLLGEGK